MLLKTIDTAHHKWHNLNCKVYCIENNFFGEKITVAGLVTATDIYDQLKDVNLGDALLIPTSMLRAEGDMFLDSITVEELSNKLNINSAKFLSFINFNTSSKI